MDGKKILISGFEAHQKLEIGKLVTDMGGVVHTETSSDISFVIVKNVLTAEYKWALNVQKPTVSLSWLLQCWKERRLVPHESYCILPFSGLVICVANITTDEWDEMTNAVWQNGGMYSDDVTSGCTHLVCYAPEGEKYQLAKRLGNIFIVTLAWFEESVTRKARLNEELYPVQIVPVPQINVSTILKEASTCPKEELKNETDLYGCAGDGQKIQHDMKSGVFEGKVFCIGSSFPQDSRDEVVEWINQGKGMVVDDQTQLGVDFLLEWHGSSETLGVVNVSSQWVRSCLEDERLLNVTSHIAYAPLRCQIPLPGFERFIFCVSQYDEKDRTLLKNLCFHLGARFVEKLSKKVTHLLCKFTKGPKYDAASEWGIPTILCEWIYECIKQNQIVSLGPFSPIATTSQGDGVGYPSKRARILSDKVSVDVIEELVELTSKIGVLNSPWKWNENVLSHDYSLPEQGYMGSRAADGLTERLSNRFDSNDDMCTPVNEKVGSPDSLVGTPSQVVGYGEDFSGRQALIDRDIERRNRLSMSEKQELMERVLKSRNRPRYSSSKEASVDGQSPQKEE